MWDLTLSIVSAILIVYSIFCYLFAFGNYIEFEHQKKEKGHENPMGLIHLLLSPLLLPIFAGISLAEDDEDEEKCNCNHG